MLKWIAGEQEDCWKVASDIECQRMALMEKGMKRKAKHPQRPKPGERLERLESLGPEDRSISKEQMTTYKRAKK